MRRAFLLVPRSIPDGNAGGSLLRVLRLRWSHAHDFNFETAEVWVVVLADAVGEIDEASLGELKLDGALGQVPADGADGGDRRGGSGQAGGGSIR